MRIVNVAFVHASLLLFVPAVLADTPTFDSLVTLVEEGKTNELRSVLKAYPDAVHIRNANSFPFIHRAAMTDQHQAVAVLIDAGAKVNSRDTNFGRTPLHIAAGWSTLAMVQLFWSHGADPKATTEKGATVLDFAMDNFYKGGDAERAKIVAFLRGRGSQMSEGEKERQAVIKEVERDLATRPDKGAEPKQSEWDGSVDIVQQYVTSTTRDPSAKFDAWSTVTALGDKWAVRAKFQYRNAVGVVRQDDRWFYIRDGEVIGTKPAQ